jgi:LytTr DNA-binding domain-containing protein
MAVEERSIDWRQVAVWAVLLTISVFARAHVDALDEARRGITGIYGRMLAIEVSSHIVVAALIPVLYWMHRRWPIRGGLRNVALHALALLPFSLIHTVGMAALRLVWFSGILGEAYSFPLTLDRMAYEFAKDIINYGMLSAAVMALRHLFARPPTAAETPARPPSPPPQPESLPERFAVRKRGKEIMVEVADIDWIEAAGNYAVLHVGGETLEIRSSLTRLEGELDAKRFVRVHKSYVVNVARIAEVTPWISGDWRIRLQDGAEVNLSRRYRQRFEALVPVRS